MTTNELLVPDALKLKNLAQLVAIDNPYEKFDEAIFLEAMREICEWHMECSAFYRRLADMEGFNRSRLTTMEDLAAIPSVLAHFFKEHEALSVPREKISLHLTSSGTSGQKSQVFFDDWSIQAPQRMLDQIFDHYGWITPDEKVNYLLYTYETASDSKLGTAYTDNYLCKYAPAAECVVALRLQGDATHSFDFFGVLEALKRFEKAGLPVRIFGFPAFLNETLDRLDQLAIPPFKLHPSSLVFLGGGWKGKVGHSISKQKLYEKTTRLLGIPNHRLRDGFGSVEHCIPYVECHHHEFHVPIWSHVIIRDLHTLKPISLGEAGFLSFVSPYMTSMPAHAVTMGDLASLHEACPCGNPRPYFRLIGRAGTSHNKSCAIAAAELLGKSS